MIFAHHCGSNDLAMYPEEPVGIPEALVLGMVCAHWRKIMVSTPQLWSSITISRLSCRVEPTLDTVEVYLERSRQLPLTLLLEEEESWSMQPNELLHRLFNHSHRLRDLTLYVDPQFSQALPAIEKNSMPLLESLNLTIPSENFDFLFDRDQFQTMPALRTLRLSASTSGEDRLDESSLPWSQITHLERTDCHVYDFVRLLSRCPSVMIAEMRRARSSWDMPDGEAMHPPCSATSNLHTLRVGSGRQKWDSVSLLFDCLTLPCLKSLSLENRHDYGGPSIWPQTELSALITRSSCSITSLSLANMYLSEDQFLGLLRSLPSITHLKFREHDYYARIKDGDPSITADTFLHLLTVSSESLQEDAHPPLLPKLEHIDFELRAHSFTDRCFVNMVESRWSPAGSHGGEGQVASLRSVGLCVAGRLFNPKQHERLRSFVKEGMKVEVSELYANLMNYNFE